ncbi:MAG: hypothetical protein RIQ89_1669, partial [Bacteroidota bacterium]
MRQLLKLSIVILIFTIQCRAQTFLPRKYPLDGNALEILQGFNGTLGTGPNTPISTSDRFGNGNGAMFFDGNDFISIPTTNLLSPTYTYAAWVTISQLPVNEEFSILAVGDNIGDQFLGCAQNQFGNGFTGSMYYAPFPGYLQVYDGLLPNYNTWYRLIFTYGVDQMALWVNGIKIDSANTLGQVPFYGNQPYAAIGARNFPFINAYNWHGKIDELEYLPFAINDSIITGERASLQLAPMLSVSNHEIRLAYFGNDINLQLYDLSGRKLLIGERNKLDLSSLSSG